MQLEVEVIQQPLQTELHKLTSIFMMRFKNLIPIVLIFLVIPLVVSQAIPVPYFGTGLVTRPESRLRDFYTPNNQSDYNWSFFNVTATNFIGSFIGGIIDSTLFNKENLTNATLWNITTGNIYPSEITVNVGIGTTSPVGTLSIPDNKNITFGTGGDSMIYYDGTDTFWDLNAVGDGDLMLALAGSFPSPDPESLHIWRGTAGSVAGDTSSVLVVEGSNTAEVSISILSPDSARGSIRFKSPTSASEARIDYFHVSDTPADTLGFVIAETERLRYSAGAFDFREATTISTSTGDLTIDASGDFVINDNVGIGTTTPAEKLVVIGNVNVSGTLNVSGVVSFSNLVSCDTIDTDANGVLSCGTDGGGGGGTSVWNSSGSDVFLNDSTANLGLGVQNSGARLNVSGEVAMLGGDIHINRQIFGRIANNNPAYSFFDDSNTGYGSKTSDQLQIMVTGIEILKLTNVQLEMKSGANKGQPDYSFQGDTNTGMLKFGGDNIILVAGSINFLQLVEGGTDELVVNEDSVDINFRVETNNQANMFFIDGGNDKIGIGTNTPTMTLEVVGNVSLATGADDNNISFFGGYADTGFTFNASGDLSMSGDLVIDGTCISEGADCSTDIAELMHSKASFGNTSCTVTAEHTETITKNFYNETQEQCNFQLIGSFYELVCANVTVKVEFNDVDDICGDDFVAVEGDETKFNKVTVCQNTTSTYTEDEFRTIPKTVSCSLNQNFVKEFESGDVVCIDSEGLQRIKHCDTEYDRTVLSVINYEATMIINQRAPYPVSLAGNIPVRVDCSTQINVGDLLVSSNTKGLAQSYLTDIFKLKIGSVFAKALESCSSGTDTIRALLT